MNIAILHHAFTESGGAERVVINQARGLQALGHKVTGYGAAVNRKKCFPDEINDLQVKPYLFNMVLPKFQYAVSLSTSLLLAPWISPKLREYDVLLCHHLPAPCIAYQAFIKYHIPYVCYMEHPPRFIYPREVEQKLGWGHDWDRRVIQFIEGKTKIVKRRDLLSVLAAKAVVVNSRNIAREVERIYGISPIVCYPGVDMFPGYGRLVSQEILNKYNIAKPFILNTGRHTPHKRLEWLLTIYEKVVNKMPEASLVIVGSFHSSYTPKLQQLARSLGLPKVHFLSYVSSQELALLYREASVYAFTAPNEDFGLGPVEAMGCGMPAVAWDDGAGPSETIIDGETGFKAKPYELDDFSEKILRILRDNQLRQKLGEKAIIWVKQNCRWDRHVKIMEKILAESCRK